MQRRRGRCRLLAVLVLGIGMLALAEAVLFFRFRDPATEFAATIYSPKLEAAADAVSDLQRLALELSRASAAGGADAGSARRLAVLASVVRARSRGLDAQIDAEDGGDPMRYLTGRLDFALAAVAEAQAEGWPEIAETSELVHGVALDASVNLAKHRESLRWQEEATLRRRADALRQSRIWLAAGMAAVAFCSVVFLGFLLREDRYLRRQQEAERRAVLLATSDPLTGLANRGHFQEALAVRLEGQGPLTVVMLDLDDFKSINDTHGHVAGDLVLTTFAGRLAGLVEARSGLAARLGGDEFAVILPTEEEGEILDFCNGVLQEATRPVPCQGLELAVRVSIGAAGRGTLPEAGGGIEGSLLSAADYALYAAKEAGRSTVRIFDTTLAVRQAERRLLLSSLPEAIRRGELIPHFQPKIDLSRNRVAGFEALVRWDRDGQILPPAAFLPMAEQAGLILDIDRFMLRAATSQIARWNERLDASLGVSVNLSARHFRSDEVVRDVTAALAASGLEPWHLTLEITETLLIEDWERVNGIFADLKALGVLISLDDFGTGYSSIAYLRKLAADELKIDKEFMQDIARSEETRFLLDAIVDMAHTMHMTIVAEGIETSEQAKIVLEFGCRYGQGYLWAPPLPPERIEAEILPYLAIEKDWPLAAGRDI